MKGLTQIQSSRGGLDWKEEGSDEGRKVHPQLTAGGALYGNFLTKVRVPTNQRNACAIEAFLTAG